jgi:hypothetical protein
VAGTAGVAGVAAVAGSAGVAGVPVVAGSAGVAGVAGAAGSAGVAESAGSVSLVCAPPLLPTVTPGATSLLVEVAPVAPVASVPLVPDPLVAVDPPPVVVVTDESFSVGDVAFVDDSPVDVEFSPVDEELADSVLEPVVSAPARLGEATTITPIPKAAASAPTRPM